MPRTRGRDPCVRDSGRGEHSPRRRPVPFIHPIRPRSSRARGLIHGRDIRKADRERRGLFGHPRSRGDQPPPRCRRRNDQLDAPRRSFCAGRNESELQGVAPGSRPGVDVCSGHEMVCPHRNARGATGDDQEGLQTRTDRAARRRVSRRARRHRKRRVTRRRETTGRQRSPARRTVPEPGGPRRFHTQGGIQSNRPGRPRRSSRRRRTRPDRASPKPSESRWRRRSMARVSSPTTTHRPWARSDSCGTTT